MQLPFIDHAHPPSANLTLLGKCTLILNGIQVHQLNMDPIAGIPTGEPTQQPTKLFYPLPASRVSVMAKKTVADSRLRGVTRGDYQAEAVLPINTRTSYSCSHTTHCSPLSHGELSSHSSILYLIQPLIYCRSETPTLCGRKESKRGLNTTTLNEKDHSPKENRLNKKGTSNRTDHVGK